MVSAHLTRSRASAIIFTALCLCADMVGCRSNGAPGAGGATSATTAAATSPSRPEGSGRIVGVVKWKKDGTPAPGVAVLAQGMDSVDVPESTAHIHEVTTTDQSGRYEINGLAPGEYQVSAFERPRLPEKTMALPAADAGRVANIRAAFRRHAPDVVLPYGEVVHYDLTLTKR